jgi:hypothetical protein
VLRCFAHLCRPKLTLCLLSLPCSVMLFLSGSTFSLRGYFTNCKWDSNIAQGLVLPGLPFEAGLFESHLFCLLRC